MSETTHTKADGYSPLTLAFLGDGVYDLLVREGGAGRIRFDYVKIERLS